MNEKKVLLIDDEASLRRSLTLGLMQKGYETEPCENGMKGLKLLESFKKKQICEIFDRISNKYTLNFHKQQ